MLALCLCASVAAPLRVSSRSASRSVRVGKLDIIHFRSRALNATRTVRVWLPPGFSRRARYAVLYLNDGQNLFGDGDPESGGDGWHADETAARLSADRTVEPLILVGIDNAGDSSRAADYLPVVDPFSEDPEPPRADQYLAFVIDELMPFVDGKYPTRREVEARAFGGSSYGAASALYAVMARPGVFGRMLLESPSVGVGGGVLLDRARTVTTWPQRIVMGIGTGEGRGGRGAPAFQTLIEILHAAGLGDDRLKVVVQEGGRHDQESWAARFPDALTFLFSSLIRGRSQ
jgi:enterochelin esterase-like enzyme